MSSIEAINYQSLNMVQEELVATIDSSASSLARFVESQEDTNALQESIESIRQIVGILDVVQLSKAKLLATELLETANEITPGNTGNRYNRQLEVVSNSFFILMRYLEYLKQSEQVFSVLLLPYVNELRKARGERPYPESFDYEFEVKFSSLPKVKPLNTTSESLQSMVRRLRHMYQVGLIGIIRGKPPKASLMLMRRSVIRMHRLATSAKPMAVLWLLADQVLHVMSEHNMSVKGARQHLFSRIEREMAVAEKEGEAAFAKKPESWMVRELMYLLSLSGDTSKKTQALLKNSTLEALPFTDADLEKERSALNGPSIHTITSLAKVLQTELGASKKVLENASQTIDNKVDDIDEFIEGLDKISDILSLVGLVSPSKTLKDQIDTIKGWRANDGKVSEEELQGAANTMLYIESAVVNLENAKLSDDKLEQANALAQEELIASSQLGQATGIVIEECEQGLALTKRALSAFTDSDYDNGHVRNLATTLDTVRGGMSVLGKDHAADILGRCAQFVEDTLLDADLPPALQELLETFADAIIALDYYLDSMNKFTLQSDESVLKIAEESLSALGYPNETDDA